LLVALQVADRPGAASPAPDGLPRLEALVKQLGASRYLDRERAQHELEKIGAPALDLLRKAAASEDAEVNRRAGELVQKIENAVLASRLLSPTRVNLSIKDTPLPAALAELQRQSGYKVFLAGKPAPVEKRRVSLVTGEVTFWEALDALCRKARLVEVYPEQQNPPPGAPPVRIPKVPKAAGMFQPPASRAIRVALAAQPEELPPVGWMRFFSYPADTHIAVADGKPSALPTCYAGAVRLRASPVTFVKKGAGEAVLLLEVTAEPRLSHFQIAYHPMLRKTIDEQDRPVALARESAPWQRNDGIGPWQVPIRLKLGQKPPKMLKKLEGQLTASALGPPEPVVTVDNILQAAGRTARGKKGASMQVLAVTKLPGSDLQIQARISDPGRQGGGNWPGGRENQGAVDSGLPSLADDRGQAIPPVQVSRRLVKLKNGDIAMEVVMTFRTQAGQGEPARLVLMGQRTVMLPVSFSLADVPLNLKNEPDEPVP
jgi:hypothetical protein